MHKAHPHIDLGTGYIQLSRLPFNQAIQLRNSLPDTSLVTVRSEEGVLEDCIQYSEYEYWFDFTFRQDKEEVEFDF